MSENNEITSDFIITDEPQELLMNQVLKSHLQSAEEKWGKLETEPYVLGSEPIFPNGESSESVQYDGGSSHSGYFKDGEFIQESD